MIYNEKNTPRQVVLKDDGKTPHDIIFIQGKLLKIKNTQTSETTIIEKKDIKEYLYAKKPNL